MTRAGIAVAYSSIAVLTMLFRIDLGRHWTTDTIAAVVAGVVALRGLMLLRRRQRVSPRHRIAIASEYGSIAAYVEVDAGSHFRTV